jgi:hypothetical protein
MHPSELLKTPFGRVCLVKPFEYSELSAPFDKLVDCHPASCLSIKFVLKPVDELQEFNIDPYVAGILKFIEDRLNNFGRELF